MNHFLRALKEAWRHWFILASALVCSLLAAALWGANIAAMFPIIETTLHGKSIPEGNQERIDLARQQIAECQKTLAKKLEERIPNATPERQAAKRRRIDELQTQLAIAERSLAFHLWLKPWVDRYLPAKPFPTVLLIVTIIAAATLIKQILSVTGHMLVSYVSQSIARSVRMRIFDKALTLDRPGFNKLGTSGFAANITHTTEMLSTGITSFYHGAFSEPFRILACLAVAFYISWRLTLVSLIFAPLIGFLMLGLNRRIRALSTRTLQRSLGFHHVMLEVFQSIVTVQAYTMEDFERDRFRKSTSDLRRASLLAHFYNILTNPLTEVLGVAMLCTALAAAAYLVINQKTHIFGLRMTDQILSIATIMVFFGAILGAADPLRKLSVVITGVNTGMAASGILYPILDMQPKVLEPKEAKKLPLRHECIEFRNISFSYDGEHKVLTNVNLKVPFGEHLAIVGPNGGGKSTLMNLLCRFFDPQEGEVLIDGISIRDVPLKDLRSRISLVTQQTELFNESILHNIRYGRWDATEEEIFAAARRAKAHDFITGFPEGYQTLVGPNGQRLSGGQRQRIALARAILRNAEILILDEATSQIDRESEQLIHQALAELGKDRTMIMITHRESTLSLATKIVQVQHGELTPQQVKQEKAA